MTELCDEDRLAHLLEAYKSEHPARFEQTEALIAEFPDDARLHFMFGSMLIGEGRLIEGHAALTRAVALAPDFAIARFQLGFFQLTSGEADDALETWGPLDRLPGGHYLRRFVDGLRCLIRDEFAACVVQLRAGVALNHENAPLNNDMRLIMDKCQDVLGGPAPEGEPLTETALILQHFTARTRPN